jgi:PAS domain S-box-containing protein
LSNNLSVWQKLLLVVLIPLTFELIFVISLGALLRYAQAESDRYEQSKELLLHFHRTESYFLQTTTMFMAHSDSPELLNKNLVTATHYYRETSEEIKKESAIRPELKESLAEVPALFDRALDITHRTVNLLGHRGTVDPMDVVTLRNQGLPLLIEFQQISQNVLRAELRMSTVAPEQLAQIRFWVVAALVIGMLVSVLLSGFAAYLFSSTIVERLKKIENNAHLLAMRSTLHDLPTGGDEIGMLAQSLQEAEHVLAETRSKELVILDVAADVICSLDRRLRFTAIGASAEPSWGHSATELLGESLLSIISPASEDTCRRTLKRIEQSGIDGHFECEILGKDGRAKDTLWQVSWVQANNSFYCVAHDISERRAADRMKQRFVAIVSHDLRTPLSSVSASLSLLNRGARGVLTTEAAKILDQAETSLERLMDLIRDLLDLEKLEAGKAVMDLQCVSALDVCSAARDSVEFLAKSHDVAILMPHGDAAIIGDERRLVRVLINLLSNAIKFSPRGSTVKITIKDLGDSTEISVHDQGPGIPEKDRQLIFEKFGQSKATTNAANKGTGLGLAIAKYIVQSHNGKIGCDSTEAVGTRFFLIIPNFKDKEDLE